MSDATTMDRMRELADGMERREMHRHGGTRTEARARLASRIGVLPGTLYNLGRDRLKRLDVRLREALTRHAARDLKSEIERLTHELEIAHALGASAAASDVAAMETLLAEAKALIGEQAQ